MDTPRCNKQYCVSRIAFRKMGYRQTINADAAEAVLKQTGFDVLHSTQATTSLLTYAMLHTMTAKLLGYRESL